MKATSQTITTVWINGGSHEEAMSLLNAGKYAEWYKYMNEHTVVTYGELQEVEVEVTMEVK